MFSISCKPVWMERWGSDEPSERAWQILVRMTSKQVRDPQLTPRLTPEAAFVLCASEPLRPPSCSILFVPDVECFPSALVIFWVSCFSVFLILHIAMFILSF